MEDFFVAAGFSLRLLEKRRLCHRPEEKLNLKFS
jgi:hypothetical protein